MRDDSHGASIHGVMAFRRKKATCYPHLVDTETLSEGFVWINCAPEILPGILPWLKEFAHGQLNEEHIDDCMNLQHPAFFEQYENYRLLIFRNLLLP